MDPSHIRNFAIIAHIDHGKSTLSDRLLELTGSLTSREMQAQVLDAMDLERERGITIKAHTVRMMYTASDGETYQLNLIDTPGHVDFSYEVSRSLASCEGALLVVDASQGVEAQTLANAYLAIAGGLEIIPVINKIDLPSADIERTREMIEKSVGIPARDAVAVSAKTGLNVADILEAVVMLLPPPKGDAEAPLQALIFDSWFDAYRGVIVLARIINGRLRKGDRIKIMSNGRQFDVESMGVMTPKPVVLEELSAGEVGFFVATIKNVADTKVGDTITHVDRPCAEALPGFEDIKSMVFAGLYTVDSHEHALLRDALEKLRLNDASFNFEPESSVALGFGFRCGFLGLLHLEIIQERLEREYNLDLITTAPGVRYKITLTDGTVLEVDNPSRWPDTTEIEQIEEPVITAKILTNEEYVGGILKLVEDKRGRQQNFEYVSETRVMLTYELPLNEIVLDFYDRLKSVSRGYASLDYHLAGSWVSPMVKMDILIGGDPVDALSVIVHRDAAYDRGKALVSKMRELIPRQMFEVAIQAAIGSKIIARETVTAIRKNVIAKCYGGDISRKRKLLEKQKEGKKRMKRIGKVDIPQEAFLAVMKSAKSNTTRWGRVGGEMQSRLVACFSLAFVAVSSSAQTASVKLVISPMRAIYVQDQRDRGVPMADNGDELKPGRRWPTMKDLSWEEITKRDEDRRKQVNVLLANGQVRTGQDYEDAAFIFQHGQAADDYLLAHILAMEAVVLGDTKAKWIAAATLDRYLQMIGQKQVFGTQYGDTQYAYYLQHKTDADVLQKFKTIPQATTQEPYNSKLLPGTVRKDFCVPDLSLQQKYVDDTNAGKKADIPRMPECRR